MKGMIMTRNDSHSTVVIWVVMAILSSTSLLTPVLFGSSLVAPPYCCHAWTNNNNIIRHHHHRHSHHTVTTTSNRASNINNNKKKKYRPGKSSSTTTGTRLWDTELPDLISPTTENNNGTFSNTKGPPSSSSSTKKVQQQQQQHPSLPDYGTTPVNVDTIRLPKVQKKKGTTSNNNNNNNDDDDDDTTSSSTNKWRRRDLFGSSIVDSTIESMLSDNDYQQSQQRLETMGIQGMSKEERTLRRRALSNLGIPSFNMYLSNQMSLLNSKKTTTPATTGNDDTINSSSISISNNNGPIERYTLQRKLPTVLQINIGLYCNQACGHCHVESSPLRTKEMMSVETVAKCLQLLKDTPTITTLDITGGAPELNNHFRYLVLMARSLRPDITIIDRCNLTVLQEPGQEDLIEFLKDNNVHIIASLPCYSATNVDTQRGNGVFDRSIAALLALNDAGYGIDDQNNDADNNNDDNNNKKENELKLDLVYNPLGAFLPPSQEKLEVQYKEKLRDNFGILFNSLYTITNMPIKRFADFLHRRDELQQYMDLLVRNFNVNTVNNLMCLDMISIGWDGKIYDCDFNQQLGYGIGGGSRKTVFDIESLDELLDVPIRTDNHCFGCTAGMGSS